MKIKISIANFLLHLFSLHRLSFELSVPRSSKPFQRPLKLKEAEEARTLCIAIEGLEMSADLVKALQSHSDCLTVLYREVHKLTVDQVDDIAQYQGFFDQATQYQSWFKERKRVANAMKQAAAKQK